MCRCATVNLHTATAKHLSTAPLSVGATMGEELGLDSAAISTLSLEVTRPPLPRLAPSKKGGKGRESRGNDEDIFPYPSFNDSEPFIRHDGRQSYEMREVSVRLDVVHSAAGSAFVAIGKTKVFCSVFGPKRAVRAAVECGRLQVEVRLGTSSSGATELAAGGEADAEATEKVYSEWLTQALEPIVLLNEYPKSIIGLSLLLLEDDGGALTTALTCAGTALAHAGISMTGIPVGATVVSMQCEGDGDQFGRKSLMLVDVDREEMARYGSKLPSVTVVQLGYSPSLGEACLFQAVGAASGDERLWQLAMSACFSLHELISLKLKTAVKKGLRLAAASETEKELQQQQQQQQQEEQEEEQEEGDAQL
eukprot:GHVU01088013.1.p1 GENE.GHVU01088013.1~~GHVU01088013.1.p1  ORF type:complete len:365 (-),score=75.91 GHVU01088013.1:297-1391(-)